MNPWLAVAAVLLGLAGCLVAARWLARSFGWSAEFARKTVHVGMGLGCLAFPWIFGDAAWAVWVLAAVATVGLLVLRCRPGLRSGIGAALHGVGRWSAGELLFAPAVALVFDLANGRTAWFVVPVAILTLADAAGALAGTRWGQRRYGAGSGWKSVEGSTAFLFSALVCIAVPLFLLTDMPDAKIVWIAVTLGLLAMMAEGLSDHGLDNVILPLAVFFLLERFGVLDADQVAIRCGAAAGLLLVVILCGKYSTLEGAALLAAGLLGYGLVVLGGWWFLAPVAGLFALHLLTTWRYGLHGKLQHGCEPVCGVALATLPWAVAETWMDARLALLGCALGAAVMLVLVHVGTRAYLGQPGTAPLLGLAKAVLGCVVPALPGLLPLGIAEWFAVAAGLLLAWGAAWVFTRCREGWPESGRGLWLMMGALALTCSLLVVNLVKVGG